MPALKKTMFREYDIRGRVSDDELNAKSAEWIGRGFGTVLARRGVEDTVVGYDSRFGSVEIKDGLVKGLRASGRNVVMVGMCLTPMLYWAQYRWTGAWQIVREPALCAPGGVAPELVPGLVACGNGFAAYPEAFAGASFAAGAHGDILPHAREFAVLGVAALAAGRAVPADEAQPLYLRNKVAYTSAERQAINAAKADAR